MSLHCYSILTNLLLQPFRISYSPLHLLLGFFELLIMLGTFAINIKSFVYLKPIESYNAAKRIMLSNRNKLSEMPARITRSITEWINNVFKNPGK